MDGPITTNLLIVAAGLWAGTQNALAGGGSFITLPALLLTGMTPLAANITSTVALFPGQVTSGLAGRSAATGAGKLPLWSLMVISLLGGILGAVLLLKTPARLFAELVPYLVLAATLLFTWGSFFRKSTSQSTSTSPVSIGLGQLAISIYGGYFGGGIGILMLAALTMAGIPTKNATATKNVLAAVMNASAVIMFVMSPQVHWQQAMLLGTSAIFGGLLGTKLLYVINEKYLKAFVIFIGCILTVSLFLKPIH